jgi:hypothetical protein
LLPWVGDSQTCARHNRWPSMRHATQRFNAAPSVEAPLAVVRRNRRGAEDQRKM